MLASHLLDKQQLKIISFQTLISYSYCFQSDIDISAQVTISTQGMKKTFIVLRRANKIYALSLILIMMTLLKKVFISTFYNGISIIFYTILRTIVSFTRLTV